MIRFVRFAWAAIRAYHQAQAHGSAYVGLCWRGVPQITVLVGLDRAAWHITEIALENRFKDDVVWKPLGEQ